MDGEKQVGWPEIQDAVDNLASGEVTLSREVSAEPVEEAASETTTDS